MLCYNITYDKYKNSFKYNYKIKKNLNCLRNFITISENKKSATHDRYRALSVLSGQGQIHKSNHNKTFILCNHTHIKSHNPSLAICKKCGVTEELKSDLFTNVLKKSSLKKYNFANYELEVSTICRSCV